MPWDMSTNEGTVAELVGPDTISLELGGLVFPTLTVGPGSHSTVRFTLARMDGFKVCVLLRDGTCFQDRVWGTNGSQLRFHDRGLVPFNAVAHMFSY